MGLSVTVCPQFTSGTDRQTDRQTDFTMAICEPYFVRSHKNSWELTKSHCIVHTLIVCYLRTIAVLATRESIPTHVFNYTGNWISWEFTEIEIIWIINAWAPSPITIYKPGTRNGGTCITVEQHDTLTRSMFPCAHDSSVTRWTYGASPAVYLLMFTAELSYTLVYKLTYV